MVDRHLLIRILGTTALTSLWPWLLSPAFANPQGATVVGGSALVVTTSPTVLNVDQSSQNAVINWQSFSVGAGEQTNFHQPSTSSLTVNRVTGVDPSTIAGQITANGQIVLTNPNGVVVSQGARVNAGGFIATTSGITNSNAMAGNLDFTTGSNSPTASVVNEGRISVRQGGLAALVAPGVENDGVIVARLGKVALASGQTFTLDLEGDQLVNFAVGGQVLSRVTSPTGTPLSAAVTNAGKIIAKGGLVAISVDAAEGVVDQAINMSGIVQATSAQEVAGTIVLNGGAGGVVALTGTLDASGNGAGESGGRISVRAGGGIMQTGTVTASGAVSGGSVRFAAPEIVNQGTVTADGESGSGGRIAIRAPSAYIDTESSELSAQSFGAGSGGEISITGAATGSIFVSGTHSVRSASGIGGTIAETAGTVDLVGATLDASGATGGGSIEVGGAEHGAGPLADATTTLVTPGTVIDADARVAGDGGNVVVWSNAATTFAGAITAQGGTASGAGGMVEVSSKGDLVYAGTADVGATAGTPGTLLLDPANITIESTAEGGSLAQYQLIEPDPTSGGQFGATIVTLANGNIVVTNPTATEMSATDAGAIYVYNGVTSQLVSMLTGSGVSDEVGSGGVITLPSGNFLAPSPSWSSSTGAVTFGNAATGVAGVVSATNSLVGSTAGDAVGSGGIQQLGSGNYVVLSPSWSNDTGAATFGNGTTGISGAISAANSLVGAAPGDEVGSGSIMQLATGNYLVLSPLYGSGGNGTAAAEGAVTFGSGASGVSGTVAAANSLVGAAPGDEIGSNGTVQVGNGNYVVLSPHFDTNGSAGLAYGAVTWGSGATGISGTVGSANSLIGATLGDDVGSGGVQSVGNGNYVVLSPLYGSGGSAALAFGAVTWGSGATGNPIGTTGASNSLIGEAAGDQIGSGGIVALSGGDYLVVSPSWGSGGTAGFGMGAVTYGSGATGGVGTVGSGNSLVGATPGEQLGNSFTDDNGTQHPGVVALSATDSYVVDDPYYSSPTAAQIGAVVWADGPLAGTVTSVPSLVGSTAYDEVGSGGIVALANGNFVVASPDWQSGVGAVTWGSGTTGFGGGLATPVSGTNSLVGEYEYGYFGLSFYSDSGTLLPGIVALSNGNYVIDNPGFPGGSDPQGAVVWADGSLAASGYVGGPLSYANQLVGNGPYDQVGDGGIQLLGTGNFVVLSPDFGSTGAPNSGMGAATFGNAGSGFGTDGSTTVVSAANSLVGSQAGDQVSSGGVVALNNGNYIVSSPGFGGGGSATLALGAATWGDGNAGVSGTVSAANSLIGAAPGDQIGDGNIFQLQSGNYLVLSPDYGSAGNEGSGLGAVTWGNGAAGVSGVVSAANSLVGDAAGDEIGSGGINQLQSGDYLVLSPNYGSGGNAGTGLGAVTWGNGATGISGAVSAANSLVGTTSGDQVGSGGIFTVANGNYVVSSPNWNGGFGAATFGDDATGGAVGAVSAMNSLVGSTAGDDVSSSGVATLGSGNYVVLSPNWNGGFGAATFGSGATGVVGAVSATNSLVGSIAGDDVGSSGVATLYNGNYVVLSPNWNGGFGAATFGSGATGVAGAVSAANSLVGSNAGDRVGSGGIADFTYVNTVVNGVPSPQLSDFYLVLSPSWNGNAGAVTLGSGATGVSGAVSADNSLIGNAAGAALGFDYFDQTNDAIIAAENQGNGGQVVLGLFDPNLLTFARAGGQTVTLSATSLDAALAIENVTLQATNDITVASAITAAGTNSLELDAGGSITIDPNVAITLGGSFTAIANYTGEQAGGGGISLMAGASIDPAEPNAAITLTVDPGGTPGPIDLATGSIVNAGSGPVAINSAGALVADGTVTGSTVLATATGGITLGGVITTSDPGAALTLVSGGTFTNTGGAGALVANNGNWLVYSQNPATDTVDGLPFAFVQYDASYDTTPAVTNADGLLYALVPTLSLTGITMVYDGATTAMLAPGNYTVSGVVATDTVTLSGGSFSYATANAGSNIAVTEASAPTITAMDGSAPVYGYQFTVATPDTIGTITSAPLTVTAAANTKSYDGTTSAATAPTITSGMLYGDDTASTAETYQTANADTGLTLNPTATLSDPNNYAVTLVAANTGTITPAPLTVTAAANTKGYDGTTSAAATPTITSGALYGDDTASTAETYASKNAGTGLTLNPTATLSDPNNYAVTLVSENTGIITPAPLTVTAAANTKTYDGTTGAAATPTITGTLYGDDTATAAETYASKNAGTGLTLNPSVAISDGNGGNNYAVTFVASTMGVINPEMLTVTAATNTKTYDGTTSAAATPTVTSGTLYDGATLSETYATPNAGSGLTLTPTASISDGNGGANYVVTLLASATGVIDPALLTVSVNNASRVYGSTNPSLTASVSGLEGSDTAADLGLSVATGAMNPGRFIGPAGLGGVSTAGAPVGNYPITATIADANYALNLIPGTLAVTPAALEVIVNDASRLYGTANPLLSGTVIGLIGTDSAGSVGLGYSTSAVGGTPNAAGSNAGDYAITAAIASANYTLTTIPGVLAIDPAPLTVAVGNATRYAGQSNPPFVSLVSGLAGADTAASIGLSYATSAIGGAGGVGGSPAGLYPITASFSSGDYIETLIPGSLQILPAPANGVANVSYVIPQSFNIFQRTPPFLYLDTEQALSSTPPTSGGGDQQPATTGLDLVLVGDGSYGYVIDYFAPISEGLLLPISP